MVRTRDPSHDPVKPPDPPNHPEDRAPADAAEAEPRVPLAELELRRTALSTNEIELFREVFPAIFAEHYDRVRRVIHRRGAGEPLLSDLVQDVFLSFFNQVVEHGFPDSIPAKLGSLAAGKALNERRGALREPVSLGLPSSRSETPKSGPELERVMDLKELGRRLLPRLSPEHRAAIDAVVIRELSHEEAATELGVSRTTLTSRVEAAKRRLAELAKLFLPESQRGPR